jgi:hypothetical protein
VGLDHHGGIGGRWGIFATLKKSFDGIRRGAAFAAVGLLGVGLYPIIGVLPLPVSLLVTYAMLERVPVCFALLLAVALPLAGKAPGLLDVTPSAMFAVSFSATACGEVIPVTARLIFLEVGDRIAASGKTSSRISAPCKNGANSRDVVPFLSSLCWHRSAFSFRDRSDIALDLLAFRQQVAGLKRKRPTGPLMRVVASL